MSRAFVCFLLVGVVGCGEDSTDPLPGGTFDIKATVSSAVTVEGDSFARIVIASTATVCSDAGGTAPLDRQNARVIVIELADVGGAETTAPTAPGTYTIYPNTGSRPAKSASFISGAFDGSCSFDTDASGQSGSVTLTTVAAGKFAGSYDVTLNTGDHVTGSFDPVACPALQNAADNTQHTCVP